MKRSQLICGWLVAGWLAVVWTVGGVARADGLIVVHDPPAPVPGHFTFAPLEVVYHRVTVQIDDRVAVTSVDQEFYNPNNQRLEGTYLFPLPQGAHIDKFSMDVNGQQMEAELLPADKARALYEEVLRKYQDPALLEYTGRGAFKARIFPIEPNGRKQVKLRYTEVLKEDSGLTEYTYSLNTEKFSAAPLKQVSVQVKLTSKEPIKAIYSPSHEIDVKRTGEREATVGYEQTNVRPDTDFKLIFSRAKSLVGIDLLTYRNSPDDGYFMLLASPGDDASSEAVQAKDVCFVIDTSGSMAEAGEKKMEQAKRALSFCIQNLNADDRFNIVRFSTEAEPLFEQLQPATPANTATANAYVQTLKPIGGTAIEDALKKAISLRPPPTALAGQNSDRSGPGPDRPYVVIFLTDGQPTIGTTNEDKLVEGVRQASGAGNYAPGADLRVFSFGIGTDVNTLLLDRIAGETKAFSQYVLPEEDIEVKVSGFYTKIRSPVLTNVTFAVTGSSAGVRLEQVYPNVMPDLFKGEMLIAFGRYSGGFGNAAITVSGTLNGQPRTFTDDVRFVEHDPANAFIPRLWATRRVGWLLDEIRLRGESTELRDEVVRLAREHGIVTPYTAYLIMEDEAKRNVPMALRSFRELDGDARVRDEAKFYYDTAAAGERQQKVGDVAVANSNNVGRMKQGASLQPSASAAQAMNKPSAPDPARAGYRVAQNYAQQSRVLNGKTFYQNGAAWTDAAAQSKQNLRRQEIRFNSDEYYALLSKHPNAAQWLSLGTEIDLVVEDVLYVVR